MKLIISKNLRKQIPNISLVLLSVLNVKVETGKKILTKKALKDQLKKLEETNFFKDKKFMAFRNFYKNQILAPKNEPPAVEFLYKRYLKKGHLPQVNNVVDAVNLSAMQTLIPMGIFDLDKIKGNLELRFSYEGEEFKSLTGGTEFLKRGLPVIADSQKILNKFPYRDSVYPRITTKTKNILILGDVVKGIDVNQTKSAVKLAGSLVEKHAGGKKGELYYTTEAKKDKKPKPKTKKQNYTILTGITPSGSGEVHIGNFFGAVKPFLEMAKKAKKVYFFIADLHALTTVKNKKELQSNVENIILSYLAFGFDPKKVFFYRQSDIGYIPQLQTILNNITPLGLIKRCHAYKDKLQKGVSEDSVNMGLFSYPVLMAADILLYEPDFVPVGEDQKQHLEVTRDIAQYFNKTYGKTFKLPEVIIKKQTARLVGTDGKRKMSKSLGNDISIFTDEKTIKKQIMSTFTDPTRIRPTDKGRVKGNPIFIYHDLINENKKEVEDLKKRYKQGKVGDVEVKVSLFKAHLKRFKDYRKRYQNLKNNPDKIKKILKTATQKVKPQAENKLKEVKEKIGLTNKYSFKN
jgi:tryptophanyl-tRNA synthetase